MLSCRGSWTSSRSIPHRMQLGWDMLGRVRWYAGRPPRTGTPPGAGERSAGEPETVATQADHTISRAPISGTLRVERRGNVCFCPPNSLRWLVLVESPGGAVVPPLAGRGRRAARTERRLRPQADSGQGGSLAGARSPRRVSGPEVEGANDGLRRSRGRPSFKGESLCRFFGFHSSGIRYCAGRVAILHRRKSGPRRSRP